MSPDDSPIDDPAEAGGIWDAYGKWDEFARLDDVDAIRRAITGNPVWMPNYVSPTVAYIFEYAQEERKALRASGPATVVDFGCGLGRNAPALRRLFPRVVGLDLPEMVERLEGEFAGIVGSAYDRCYGSAAELAAAEDFCALYDSVALQHIADPDYVATLIDTLSVREGFRTLVSVYYGKEMIAPHLAALRDRGWSLWHSEIDTVSFAGTPHGVAAFRRPGGLP